MDYISHDIFIYTTLIYLLDKLACEARVVRRLLNGVVVSRSALQAEGLGFNPRRRLEYHKLIYHV